MIGAAALALAVGCQAAAAAPAQLPSPRSVALSAVPAPAAQAPAAPATALQEVLAEVRIHGNHVSTDDEILKLAGITIGAPFTTTTVAEVTARLKAARRFDDVQVLKRFASIADPSRIVLVIVVNEGPVRLDVPDDPDKPIQVVRRRKWTNLMVMPILDGEDGYGLTYGARLAYVGIGGETGRMSFPLSWGGLKRAGAEFDRTFARGPITRVEIGSAIQRQKNPAFEEDDDRTRVWARAEKAFGPLRLHGSTGWQQVSFGTIDDELQTVGAGVTLDTRLNPVLPRNAVLATATIERVAFETAEATRRTRLDGRGYLGLFGQSVLVLRAVREDANRSLPPYLKSLLGGWSSLRGFEAGAYFGDTLVTGSAELRLPLSSPLSIGQLGLSAFVDTGTTYDKGQRFSDQSLHTGIGGSVWITAAAFRMGLSVARGLGASTRVNFGAGLSF